MATNDVDLGFSGSKRMSISLFSKLDYSEENDVLYGL
jgi:hypothetical protein